MLGFIFIFGPILLAVLFHLATKRWLNPYKLTLVVGKKGSGKTTGMVQSIYDHIKMGWKVYANIDIPGVYYFDPLDIGTFTFPPRSAVFIDEVNTYWDNRQYKDTNPEFIKWLRYQRQYKVKVFMYSQTFDVDKKIRAICDDLYLVSSKFRIFAWYKRILKWPDLKQAEGESEARIVDMIKYDGLIWWPFGSRKLIFIPKWAKYFKSYNPPKLWLMPEDLRWDPKRAPKFYRKRKYRHLVPVPDVAASVHSAIPK